MPFFIFNVCYTRTSLFRPANVKLVDKSIKLEPDKCETCRQQRIQCSRLLIRSSLRSFTSKYKNFQIRRLCAQQNNEQGLHSWNLACFKHPEHPAFKGLELLHIKYLSLHFDTPKGESAYRTWLIHAKHNLEGDEFRKEFELLESLRNRDLNDYERTLSEAKYLSNHPRSHER